jgi:hypothetical protein
MSLQRKFFHKRTASHRQLDVRSTVTHKRTLDVGLFVGQRKQIELTLDLQTKYGSNTMAIGVALTS